MAMAVGAAYSAAHSPKECLVHRNLTTRRAPSRSTLLRPLVGLLLFAALAGCTRQVVVKGDWTEGVAHPSGFANILVVGISPDVNARCAFEQSMTANLRSENRSRLLPQRTHWWCNGRRLAGSRTLRVRLA